MALAKCLECGKEVSRSAVACPHCGKPEPTKTEFAKKNIKKRKMMKFMEQFGEQLF